MQKAESDVKGKTRFLLLAYYLFLMSFTGQIIAAVEPLKDLLLMRGVRSDLSKEDQWDALCDITNFGTAVSVFSSLVAGPLTDWAGPKTTAVLGQLSSLIGFSLLFFGPVNTPLVMYVGAACLGFVYASVTVSHASIAALFPANTTLVVSMCCIGVDISLIMPTVLRTTVTWLGSLQTVIIIYLVINSVFVFTEFLFVPSQPFEKPSLSKEESCYSLLENTAVAEPTYYTNYSVGAQIFTSHYLVFMLFAGLNFFRKTHYQQLVKTINLSIGTDPRASLLIVEWFKYLLPSAMIFAFINGILTNRFGIPVGILLVNTWATLLYLCNSCPILPLQWLAIVFYNAFSSFIFGLMIAFLGKYYGFKTFGILQGLQRGFCGVVGLSFSLWNRYFVKNLNSLLTANRMLLGVSVAVFAIPAYFFFSPPPENRLKQQEREGNEVCV